MSYGIELFDLPLLQLISWHYGDVPQIVSWTSRRWVPYPETRIGLASNNTASKG